jgi:general secretion pathway protein J
VKRHSNDAGFTLIELLVAMTVFGFLSVLLFGGLRFGVRAWERTTDHTVGTDDIRLTQAFLRKQIGRAYPGLTATDATRVRGEFVGDEDSIEFLAPLPVSLGGAGRGRVTLAKTARGERFELTATIRPELAARGVPLTEPVLRGAASVEFAYFGSRSRGETPAWHAQWTGAVTLPKLVRIRATFASGDARIWPDLIIAPQVTANVACVIDAMTHDCRGRS